MKYDQFIFKDYSFDKNTKTLTLAYSLDDQIEFREKYTFDFDFVDYDQEELTRAIETLFFMAGVSYFKAFVPKNITAAKGSLDSEEAKFFSKVYERGLGEFWFVNKIDPKTKVSFPVNTESKVTISADHGNGLLVGLGGGKDSLLIVEALKNGSLPLTTWSLNHRDQFEPLAKVAGTKHLFVERQIDPLLLELNSKGALNGHIPISAIIACTGVIVAVLSGNRDIVVGNEHTANEPTLTYEGVEINHQYSKTQEFEVDFQALLRHLYGDSLRFYSFLRPLSELRIAEIFSKICLDKYKDVFSSCNKAYVLSSDHMSWCGECPKCVFMYLILSPFVTKESLDNIWGGKNLLLEPNLQPVVRQILGIDGDKPLDCVGEIKESRAAMRMAEAKFPELKGKYAYDLPSDYDYRAVFSDEMPEDIKPLFSSFIGRF